MALTGQIEWEVVWFPPDAPDQRRVYKTEAEARRRFEDEKDIGHCPMLSNRQVVRNPWRLVENSTDR